MLGEAKDNSQSWNLHVPRGRPRNTDRSKQYSGSPRIYLVLCLNWAAVQTHFTQQEADLRGYCPKLKQLVKGRTGIQPTANNLLIPCKKTQLSSTHCLHAQLSLPCKTVSGNYPGFGGYIGSTGWGKKRHPVWSLSKRWVQTRLLKSRCLYGQCRRLTRAQSPPPPSLMLHDTWAWRLVKQKRYHLLCLIGILTTNFGLVSSNTSRDQMKCRNVIHRSSLNDPRLASTILP